MAQMVFNKRSVSAWEPTAYATNEIATVIAVNAGDVVGGAFIRITEAFNGSTGDPTIEIGDGTDTNGYLTYTNAAATVLGLKGGTGVLMTEVPGHLYTTADTVDINFVEDTSANTTSGILDLWIYVAEVDPR